MPSMGTPWGAAVSSKANGAGAHFPSDNPVKSPQPRGRSARGQAHQPVWGRPMGGWKAGLWQFSELHSLPDQASGEILTCRSPFYFSALFIYTTYRAPRRLVSI